MARKQPDHRRKELIEIAARQFFTQGYEKTSIRSIVGEAQGEVGMFYHHFSSKDEIFEVVLELFCEAYIQNVKIILQESQTKPFSTLFHEILLALEKTNQQMYVAVTGSYDRQMLQALHHKTLLALKPLICDLVDTLSTQRTLAPPDVAPSLLVSYILFGISAVVHDTSEQDRALRRQAAETITHRILGLL